MSKEELIEHARAIKEYCMEECQDCKECPFYHNDLCRNSYPGKWELPKAKGIEKMTIDEALEELNKLAIPRDGEQNRLADAFDMAVKALENQMPKKIRYDYDGYPDGSLVWENAICPNCGFYRSDCHDTWEMPFCPECGQKLDWSKEENK